MAVCRHLIIIHFGLVTGVYILSLLEEELLCMTVALRLGESEIWGRILGKMLTVHPEFGEGSRSWLPCSQSPSRLRSPGRGSPGDCESEGSFIVLSCLHVIYQDS